MMMTKNQTTTSTNRSALIQTKTDCPHIGGPCDRVEAVAVQLDGAMALVRPFVDDDFDLRGTVSITDCKRQCLLAFRGTTNATWCFGDVPHDPDLDRMTADLDGASSSRRAAVVTMACTGRRQ